MAIDTNGIKTELQKFCDPEYSGYLGNVPDVETAKQRAIDGWANALEAGFTSVVPPSTTVASAKSAFKVAAVGMHLTAATFPAAVNTFFAALAVGMASPSIVSGIPPVGTYIPTSANSVHEAMCADFATQLTVFATGGTAIVNAPPVFPTIPWS